MPLTINEGALEKPFEKAFLFANCLPIDDNFHPKALFIVVFCPVSSTAQFF